MELLSRRELSLWTGLIVILWFKGSLVSAVSRFCMASQMTIYGTIDSTVSATTAQDCAYQTLEAGNIAFGWDGSSQCQMLSVITGYLTRKNSTFTYYIQDDAYTGTTCMDQDSMVTLIHDLVYDGNNCPAAFTYNSNEQICQSTLSQAACNNYQGAWALPFMSAAAYPCVVYPGSQTTYADDYYCTNYFATVQIFKGTASCFANFTISSAQASNVRIVSSDGCNFVFDVDSHTLIPSSTTELDWIYATYGQVMIGAYLNGPLNVANSYYFYDNSSASSFVTGTLNPVSGGGFLYTDGSQVISATTIPNNVLMCKSNAIQSTC